MSAERRRRRDSICAKTDSSSISQSSPAGPASRIGSLSGK